MSEQAASNSFLTPESVAEFNAALTHLHPDGTINYLSFAADTMHALYLGPGVPDVIAQEVTNIDQHPPIVVDGKMEQTSAQQFVRSSNNFDLHFKSGGIADLYRSWHYYQRFAILFPGLEAAARAAVPAYSERQRASGLDGYHEEDIAELMRTSFRIMRQLIDVNDPEVVKYTVMAGRWLTS